MCKQLRENAEIGWVVVFFSNVGLKPFLTHLFNRHTIPFDTMEALLVNLEDMGGIHVEEQEVRVAYIARCSEKYRTYEMLGEIFQGDAARRWPDGGRGESSCE